MFMADHDEIDPLNSGGRLFLRPDAWFILRPYLRVGLSTPTGDLERGDGENVILLFGERVRHLAGRHS
jgi:hypothetical protein